MQLSYGATERPLIVEMSGQLDFGARPSFDVALSARQIDLDQTLGGGEGSPFAIEAAIASLVELLPRAAPPPIPGALRLDAQGVVIGGSVVQAVGVDLTTAGNSWVVDNFAAMLPGDTRVDLKGTLGLSAATTFRGHARMTSDRPAAFAAWWRGTAGSAARIGSFIVESDLDLTPDNQQLSTLVVTTAGGSIEGSVEVRRFGQSEHRFVNVGLSAKRADLVETRALTELLVGKAAGVGIGDVTLSFSATADVLSAGGVDAQSVQIDGGLENGQITFRKLSVADLAGASLDAHGSIQDPFGTPSGRIDGTVKADDITGAAKFLSSLLPESDLAQRLEDQAPILSPVELEVFAEAGAAGERLSLELSGSFADTHLYLQAKGAGSLAAPETFVGTVKLSADGQDSAKVLRQLGFDLLPVQSPPFRLNADFDGALASGGKLKLTGTAAGIDLTYDARDGAERRPHHHGGRFHRRRRQHRFRAAACRDRDTGHRGGALGLCVRTHGICRQQAERHAQRCEIRRAGGERIAGGRPDERRPSVRRAEARRGVAADLWRLSPSARRRMWSGSSGARRRLRTACPARSRSI